MELSEMTGGYPKRVLETAEYISRNCILNVKPISHPCCRDMAANGKEICR
jgi:hypothetical protein